MKIVGIAGSIVGSKTKIAMEAVMKKIHEQYPDADTTLVDLGELDIVFSDGRNYMEYEGDTGYVTQLLMAADAIIIGTPTFQASIPGTLKNIFDLLPVDAFRDKIVSMVATAGTAKHFLMVEQHLKPILAYMKATIIPTYVFIEEKDYYRKEIINDDVHFRIQRLVEDTVETFKAMDIVRKEKEAAYDF
ncbi:NAD(P)H-dependent oxidoreductase [Caldibacillus lycopersici]|uniref:NAD(P)H-dependent oxidoreductase n=1 Tax=Perspicuibacillus lycopersici TaxID=1325689 RepID=A0AAE3LQ42_9BACI|nr:NADPH-dependent FMN reductase [Perspicuibacillus lycopersici]MCU9613029.1 NAD(P)H-dependent oxidoreductase [Perspicuibacillus lycopersici]